MLLLLLPVSTVSLMCAVVLVACLHVPPLSDVANWRLQHMPLPGKEGLTRRLEASGVRFAQVSSLHPFTEFPSFSLLLSLSLSLSLFACSHTLTFLSYVWIGRVRRGNKAEADAKAIMDAFHEESAAAKKAISLAKRANVCTVRPAIFN